MKKAVFKLHVDCGRMGELEGLFISTKEKVDKLIESEIEIYFGEVLGKHSEIYVALEEKDVSFVSDSPEVVNITEQHRLQNGFNPFDYGTPEGEDVEEIIENLLLEDAEK